MCSTPICDHDMIRSRGAGRWYKIKVVLGSREDGDDVAAACMDELPVNARCFHAHACGQCPSFSLNRADVVPPAPRAQSDRCGPGPGIGSHSISLLDYDGFRLFSKLGSFVMQNISV